MPKRGKREARVSRERGEGGTRELARSVRRSYSYWKLRHAPPKPQEGVVGCCSTHLPKLYHTPPLRVAPCACPGVCGMLVVVRSMSTHLSKTLLVQRGDTVGTEGTHSAATHVHCPTLRVGCAVGCHTRGLRPRNAPERRRPTPGAATPPRCGTEAAGSVINWQCRITGLPPPPLRPPLTPREQRAHPASAGPASCHGRDGRGRTHAACEVDDGRPAPEMAIGPGDLLVSHRGRRHTAMAASERHAAGARSPLSKAFAAAAQPASSPSDDGVPRSVPTRSQPAGAERSNSM